MKNYSDGALTPPVMSSKKNQKKTEGYLDSALAQNAQSRYKNGNKNYNREATITLS
jgi:hypothetical protein